MTLPVNRPYDEIVVSTRFADIAAVETAYFVAPCKGYIRRIYTVVQGTTNGAPTLTVTANGNAMTPTITVASGGGAGDVDSVEFTRNAAAYVTEGAAFSIASDGAGSSSTTCNIFAVIEPA